MIKKRTNWIISSPPYESYIHTKPRHPEEFTIKRVWQPLLELNDGDSIDNALLNNKYNFLLEALIVKVDHYRSYSDEDRCDNTITLGRYVDERQKNPAYEAQLKVYKKQLEEYALKEKAYEIEYEEWKLWVIEEKQRMLEKSLKDAETLLLKHGKKVIDSK